MKHRKILGNIKRNIFYTIDHVNNKHSKELSRSYKLPNGLERIYHYHIRKTGGTSLNSMFLASDGGQPRELYQKLNKHYHQRLIHNNKVFVGWNPKLIEEGYYYYAFSHLPSHAIKIPSNTYTITCLRDPVRRLSSLYSMLIQQRDEGGIHPGYASQKHYIKDTLEDFIFELPRHEREAQLYMFSKDYDVSEAAENIRNCGCYFFTEDFDDGVDKINHDLALNFDSLHLRSSTKFSKLSIESEKILREYLKNEYSLIENLKVNKTK